MLRILIYAVRPEGAFHQWREDPPRELSIALVADERFGGPGGSSDRGTGPQNPGNSGGGKAPDFWCAFEDGEEGVIGHASRNTR